MNPDVTVREPDVAPEEKETLIRVSKRDDRALVYSEVRGVVSRLLSHPLFEADTYHVRPGGRVDDLRDAPENEPIVTAVSGSVPVGCLKIQATARDTTQQAPILPKPGEVTR